MLVMISDINIMKAHGADGFVFGCLKETGTINEEQCAELLSAAAPLPCTFHRAFDCVASPEEALDTVIRMGFTRLLTSGLAPSAAKGAALIARLVSLSAGRLSVMPGGGVNAQNVSQLVTLTGVSEVHASARGPRRSLMAVPAGVSMGAASDERCWLQCDPDEVAAIRRALSSAGEEGDAA
ncbi:copper homeostasis protein cutC homolog [Amphibalanus amphitrite]|uniref:copper homeostasis protein cutC homolog n=1 Tax=Amphibalanus amphitrite TaxID=1232801 RepID=UPI001C91D605|nr:copper homeostasis protein cutC homolog [Amphibalanus amphitrite]